MKRVVLVTHYYPTHRGGVEIAAEHLAAGLAVGGLDITWFASACDAAPEAMRGIRHQPVACWNFLERRTGLPYPIWGPFGLVRLIRAIGKADLVHIHEYIYLGNLVAFVTARYFGKPIIVTQHVGVIPYRSRALRGLLDRVNRTVGRLVLGHADQVIFISRRVQHYFSRFVSFPRAPLNIPNGVDTETFYPASDDERRSIREELGIRVDHPVVLFAGRFVEKKGLIILRELASRLPHIDWLFAGWGSMHPDSWQLPNVRAMEGRSGASLRPLYQVADLLVLPSVGEGFPLVVQEAMACGTPAIVSDETAAGRPEAAKILYIEPLGIDAVSRWSARIDAIVSDGSDMSSAHRQQTATFARERWSMDRTIGSYRALFEGLGNRRIIERLAG